MPLNTLLISTPVGNQTHKTHSVLVDQKRSEKSPNIVPYLTIHFREPLALGFTRVIHFPRDKMIGRYCSHSEEIHQVTKTKNQNR